MTGPVQLASRSIFNPGHHPVTFKRYYTILLLLILSPHPSSSNLHLQSNQSNPVVKALGPVQIQSFPVASIHSYFSSSYLLTSPPPTSPLSSSNRLIQSPVQNHIQVQLSFISQCPIQIAIQNPYSFQ